MKLINSLIALLLASAAMAQNIVTMPKLQWQASYFNELGYHHGFKVGLSRFFYNSLKQTKKAHIKRGFNMGVGANVTYYHQPKYAEIFIYNTEFKMDFVREKQKQNGTTKMRFWELNMGVGLHQSYLRGDVYRPTNNGFTQMLLASATGIAPTLSMYWGGNVPRLQKPILWHIGIDIAHEFSSTRYGIPVIGATAGLRYNLK